MIAVFDEDTELARGVAGKRDEGDVAGLGQTQAPRERSERRRLEVERSRVEPGGPPPVRIAAKLPAQAGGVLELGARDEDLAGGEVMQSARVVGVQVGHHDPPNIARSDTDLLELWADLVLGRKIDSRTAKRKTGCQAGKYPGKDARAVSPVSMTITPSGCSIAKAKIGSGSVQFRSRMAFTGGAGRDRRPPARQG